MEVAHNVTGLRFSDLYQALCVARMIVDMQEIQIPLEIAPFSLQDLYAIVSASKCGIGTKLETFWEVAWCVLLQG
jgi:hypothetical protein